MATEVLLAEDQLSKHQYWKSSSLRSGSTFCYLPRSQSAPRGSSRSENLPRPRSQGKANQAQAAGIRSKSKKPTSPNGRVPSEVNKQPKVAFVVKERGLVDKSNFQQEHQESLPKITILQRPRSREAAMVDLAKITGLPLSEVYAKNGLSPPKGFAQETERARPASPAPDLVPPKTSRKKQLLELRTGQGLEEAMARRKAGYGVVKKKNNNNVEALPKRRNQVKGVEVASKLVEAAAKPVEIAAKVPCKVHDLGSRRSFVQLEASVVETATTTLQELQEELEQQQQQQQVQESAVEGSSSLSPSLRLSRCMSESFKSFGDVLFQVPLFDEKWAGPAFTNSPPPSSLPLPKFMKKEASRPLTTRPVTTTTTTTTMATASFAAVGGGSKANEAELVLRRILNLDLC